MDTNGHELKATDGVADIRPFHCGSQFHDWKAHNCDNCKKGYDYRESVWRCDLERKIDEAAMDVGAVDAEVAKRMGVPDDCRAYSWRCSEFVEDTSPKPGTEPVRHALDRPADWIQEWAQKRGIDLETGKTCSRSFAGPWQTLAEEGRE